MAQPASAEKPGQWRCRIRAARSCAPLLLLCASMAALVAANIDPCAPFSFGGSGSLASQSANCSGCIHTPGCSYCLQTLQCAATSSLQMTCRSSLALSAADCPIAQVADICAAEMNCTSCVSSPAGCAWCGSQQACMPNGMTLAAGCRSTVWDLPCPTSLTEGMSAVCASSIPSRILSLSYALRNSKKRVGEGILGERAERTYFLTTCSFLSSAAPRVQRMSLSATWLCNPTPSLAVAPCRL